MTRRRPSPREPAGDRLTAAAQLRFPDRKSRGAAAVSGACRTAAATLFEANRDRKKEGP